MRYLHLSSRLYQKGSTLLVSLIMLLVVTVIGVSTMSNIGVNEKMAANYRDHDLAFQAAEAALEAGEEKAEAIAGILNGAGLDKITNYFGCSSTNCFTNTCLNGLCFTGTYPALGSSSSGGSGSSGKGKGKGGSSGGGSSASTDGICDVPNASPKLWEQAATWTTSGRAATHPVSISGLVENPKYIVEFMCYVLENPNVAATTIPPDYGSEWGFMFRITALGTGATPKSKAMVQSTFKVLR